ncbi:MFS transporter [Lactiplantibacillus plajomi]|uniref:MFS transporter n=1 Tax=Lactiplantibacillus plajomi TaxID=1457217 RepID=A0ABV6K8S7_9LACO|nr:MFS transporter [Lactiplantibacillus plajomi]
MIRIKSLNYRVQATILVFVTFMLGCNEFMVVGILSDISNGLNVAQSLVGFLVTAFAVVYALSTPIINLLTSKFNHYSTLLLLMVVFFVGNTLSAMSFNYAFMFVSRILTASVSGVIASLMMTFANEIAPLEKRAGLVSAVFAGSSIASVIGVPIGTIISSHYGWRMTFIVISVITIFLFVLQALFLPKHSEQVSGTISDQLTILKEPQIIWGILLVVFSAAIMYSYYTYIQPILTTLLGFSSNNIDWLLGLIGLMMVISNILAGVLANHGGLKRLPIFYILDAIILAVFPLFVSSKVVDYLLLLAISLIVTLLNAPIQLHFLNVAEQKYPQSIVFASSFPMIFFQVGISLGSAAASLFMSPLGLENISIVGVIFSLIALVVLILLNRAISRSQNYLSKDENRGH